MRHNLTLFLIMLLASGTSFAADAAKGFTTANLNIGYMPQEELGERVPVKDLADYFKQLEAICSNFLPKRIRSRI